MVIDKKIKEIELTHPRRGINNQNRIRLDRQVIIAAAKRGILLDRIAICSGVSHQRIDQIVREHERNSGEILRRRNASGSSNTAVKLNKNQKMSKTTTLTTCQQCGKRFFEKPAHANNRVGFCSNKCWGVAQRQLSEADIRKAIDMRFSHMTWKATAKHFAVPVQTIQKRIWRHLYHNGDLTSKLVHDLWDPVASEFRNCGKWNWLINSTKMIPA